MCPRLPASLFAALRICLFAWATWAASAPVLAVDFLREVQPILAEHCTLCHGADDKERQSGLRLKEPIGGGGLARAGPPDESHGPVFDRSSSRSLCRNRPSLFEPRGRPHW